MLVPPSGPNGVQQYNIGFKNVVKVVVKLSHAGALAEISYYTCDATGTPPPPAPTTPPPEIIAGCDTCTNVEYYYFKYETNDGGTLNAGGLKTAASNLNNDNQCSDVHNWYQAKLAADPGFTVHDSTGIITGDRITITAIQDKPNGMITVDLPPDYWVVEDAHAHKAATECFGGPNFVQCANDMTFLIAGDGDGKVQDISHIIFIFAKCNDGATTATTSATTTTTAMATTTTTGTGATTTAATVTSTTPTSPGCVTKQLNFDGPGISRGDYISTQFQADFGVSITCNSAGVTGNACRIFDTNVPYGNYPSGPCSACVLGGACTEGENNCGDPDLGSPNVGCGGPGIGAGGDPSAPYPNCEKLDNVLILDEHGGTDRPPDDNMNGGSMMFAFSQCVNLHSIAFLDNESIENHHVSVSVPKFYKTIVRSPTDLLTLWARVPFRLSTTEVCPQRQQFLWRLLETTVTADTPWSTLV